MEARASAQYIISREAEVDTKVKEICDFKIQPLKENIKKNETDIGKI
jgi:hypothetical protein